MTRTHPTHTTSHTRLRIVAVAWLVLVAAYIARLFFIQIVDHAYYNREASNARSINEIITARRGEIYARDARVQQDTLYPLALNRDQIQLISDNRKITDPAKVAHLIATNAQLTTDDETALTQKLSDATRAYQVLLKDLDETHADAVLAALDTEKIDGITIDRTPARLYPERDLTAHITGFLGHDAQGSLIGRYGVEGFFDTRLQGVNGYVRTEEDPTGGWIPVADRDFKPAQNGDDVILTIDRAIQYELCDALQRGVKTYSAVSATGAIMDPNTGYILAMCSVPTFDPNAYQKETSAGIYNNDFIFRAYEPGSVFKAFTMSAALDVGAVTPDTTYVDAGFVKRDGFTIRNAGDKSWGTQTMTDVIKESINTGTVFAAEKIGPDIFQKYVHAFAFGQRTGIELKVEEKGDVRNLGKKGVYLATQSFGQGLTVTPMQLLQGYSAIAHGGVLVHPTMIYAWRSPDGTTTVNQPDQGTRVIKETTAQKMLEMLRIAVEEGHGKLARVPGYSVGGKTGTAQIAGANGKYLASGDNHTFAGIVPISNPRFVMVIKYEAPHARYAESTAVPTFGEVAKFLLEYLGVPPDEPVQNK